MCVSVCGRGSSQSLFCRHNLYMLTVSAKLCTPTLVLVPLPCSLHHHRWQLCACCTAAAVVAVILPQSAVHAGHQQLSGAGHASSAAVAVTDGLLARVAPVTRPALARGHSVLQEQTTSVGTWRLSCRGRFQYV